MVDLIGDLCIPSQLVIPQIPVDGSKTPSRMSGTIFMSGAKLYFLAGVTVKSITSD